MANLELELKTKTSTAQLDKLFEDVRRNAEGAAKALNDAFGGTVSKKIVYETIVDEKGARQLVAVEKERLSVADKIINAQKQLDKVQIGSLTSLRQQVNNVKQLRDGIAKYESGTRNVSEAWTATNQKLATLNRELALASASGFWDKVKAGLNAQGIVNFSNGLVQITQGLQAASITIGQITGSINKLIQASAGLQEFALAFRAIGQGSAGASQALSESSRIALNLGVSVKTVRQAFQQLSPVILNSGGSIGDVSKVVESLSTRFAAFGISGDRAKRVMNAVTQVFAKGKLQAEEFTQQIAEADPAFGTDFAKALGVSTGRLQEMIKAGQVTTDVFLKGVIAINKSAETFGKLGISAKDAVDALAAGSVTIGQVQGKFESLGQLSLENFAKAFDPFLQSVLKIGAVIIDFLSNLSKLEIVKTLGNLFAGFTNAIAESLDVILNAVQAIASLANAIDTITGPLLRLPGVAEAVGFAILAKLIAPLGGLRESLAKTAAEGSGFGAFLARIAVGAAKPLQDADKAARGLGPSIANAFNSGKDAVQNFLSRGARLRENLASLSKENLELASKTATVKNALNTYKAKLDEVSATLERAKNSTDSFTKKAVNLNVITSKVKILTQNVKALEAELSRLEGKKLETGAKLEVNREAVKNLGAIPTLLSGLQGAGAGIQGIFKGIKDGVKGLLGAIGPLGFAFIALGTATKAYNDVNQESSAILEASRARVATLDAAITDLGGSTEQSSQPIEGLALLWAKFGFAIDGVVQKANELFEALNRLFSSASQSGTQVGEAGAGANKAAKGYNYLAIAASAALGALAGGMWGAVGAVIGGIAGALLAVGASGDDAGVRLAELRKRVSAVGLAASTETKKFVDFINQLRKLKQESELKAGGPTGQDNAALASGYTQARAALQGIVGLQQQLTSQQKTLLSASSDLGPAVQKAFPAYKNLLRIQRSIVAFSGVPGNEEYVQKLKKLQARLQKEIANSGASRADLKQYGDLQNQLVVVNKELEKTKENVETATALFNKFAKENGLLSAEQLKTAENFENLNDQLKSQQELLQLIDPSQQAAKWEEVNKEIARLTVELQALEDSSKKTQNLEIAAEIKFRVDTGSLENSLQNAQRVVESLSSASLLIDVDSPELIDVINDLVEAQSKLDSINATTARITVNAIEAQGAINTLAEIQRYQQALNNQITNLPINSAELDQAIEKARRLGLVLEALSKTKAQLRAEIAKLQAQSEISSLQAAASAEQSKAQEQVQSLQAALSAVQQEAQAVNAWYEKRIRLVQQIAQANAAAYNKRIAQIQKEGELIQRNAQREIDAINRAQAASDRKYQSQINAINQKTLAEQRLEEAEIARLQKEARDRSASQEDRDRAQAQLDQIERQKKLQEIEQQQAAEREANEQKIAEIQANAAAQAERKAKDAAELEKQKQEEAEDFARRIAAIEEEKQAKAQQYAEAQARIQVQIAGIQAASAAAQAKYQEEIAAQQEIINELAKNEAQERLEINKQVLAAKEGQIELSQLFGETAKSAQSTSASAEGIAVNTEEAADKTGEMNKEMQATSGWATRVQNAMANAEVAVRNIVNNLASLQGKTIVVTVAVAGGAKAAFAGGPVAGGELRTINELGKEGFLSSSGRLTPINKPAYAQWRAPSSGTIIPAHIMSRLDVPSTGIKVNKPRGGISRRPENLRALAASIQSGIAAGNNTNGSLGTLAAAQAQQAVELGKLSRAVNKLAEKSWGLDLKVKTPPGQGYLEVLNRSMR